MRHTKGPWIQDGTQISKDTDYRPRLPIMRLAEGSLSDLGRATTCVNGCDAAGIVDPGKLESALQAIRAASDTIRRGGSSTRQALLKINEAISSLYRSS